MDVYGFYQQSIAPTMTLKENKAALRKRLIATRDTFSATAREQASQCILRKVAGDAAYQAAHSVLAYHSFGSELSTRPFLEATLAAGKILVLPRVDGASNSLLLYRVVDLALDMEAGKWGILQPRLNKNRQVEMSSVDFVLVPGVGFDAQCGRLGYGAGFYDRLLGASANRLQRRVAGAFDCQMVDTVPTDEADVPVDCVLTETREFQRES